jgi:hypothetical protein
LDVALDADCLAAYFAHPGIEFPRTPASDEKPGAFASETLGGRKPNAAVRASHHRNFAFKSAHKITFNYRPFEAVDCRNTTCD